MHCDCRAPHPTTDDAQSFIEVKMNSKQHGVKNGDNGFLVVARSVFYTLHSISIAFRSVGNLNKTTPRSRACY